MKRFATIFSILLLLTLTASTLPMMVNSVQAAPAMELIQVQGKVTMLRAHELGSGYGPSTDFIDVEAVVRLDTFPDHRFGLKLRDDATLPSHEGMFELLRDAMVNNYTVIIDADVPPGKHNGIIIRVAVIK